MLDSERIDVYGAGRGDIAAGRIDVRVLTLLLCLAQKYDGVAVTSLVTATATRARGALHARLRPSGGHRRAAPSRSSATRSRGITERALRDILLLPEELQPEQLISLFDLGGPSFAAADHNDHIHAGF